MQRFYIDIEYAHGCCRDEEGFDADGTESALHMARRAAGEIILEKLTLGEDIMSFTLCLDDAQGERLATLPVTASFGYRPH